MWTDKAQVLQKTGHTIFPCSLYHFLQGAQQACTNVSARDRPAAARVAARDPSPVALTTARISGGVGLVCCG